AWPESLAPTRVAPVDAPVAASCRDRQRGRQHVRLSLELLHGVSLDRSPSYQLLSARFATSPSLARQRRDISPTSPRSTLNGRPAAPHDDVRAPALHGAVVRTRALHGAGDPPQKKPSWAASMGSSLLAHDVKVVGGPPGGTGSSSADGRARPWLGASHGVYA